MNIIGPPTAEHVLAATADAAVAVLGTELAAVFALGSLAHGGFAPLVSDIDVAVIVSESASFTAREAERIKDIVSAAAVNELGQRLSLFWTDWRGVQHGASPADRLPALDRLDLLDNGRVLYGEDCRSGATAPSTEQLITEGAEFACAKFDSAYLTRLHQPDDLVADGPRATTKAVLFPVRLLYTLYTHRIGLNADAAQWYTEHGAHRPLTDAALRWRDDGIVDPHFATDLLRTHLLGLYREFFIAYQHALATNHPDLAVACAAAHDRLR